MRLWPISFGGTRTTRSPWPIKKRSNAPETMAAVLEREEALAAQLAGPGKQLLVPGVPGLDGQLPFELRACLGNRDGGVGLLVRVDSNYDHLVPFRF